jgi:hypothetical protein
VVILPRSFEGDGERFEAGPRLRRRAMGVVLLADVLVDEVGVRRVGDSFAPTRRVEGDDFLTGVEFEEVDSACRS